MDKILAWFRSLNQLVRMHQDQLNWYLSIFVYKSGRIRMKKNYGQPPPYVKYPDTVVGLSNQSDGPIFGVGTMSTDPFVEIGMTYFTFHQDLECDGNMRILVYREK